MLIYVSLILITSLCANTGFAYDFKTRIPLELCQADRRPATVIREQKTWLSYWVKIKSCTLSVEIQTEQKCDRPQLILGSPIEIARIIHTKKQTQYELLLNPKDIHCANQPNSQNHIENSFAYLHCIPTKTDAEIKEETSAFFEWAGSPEVQKHSDHFSIDTIKRVRLQLRESFLQYH